MRLPEVLQLVAMVLVWYVLVLSCSTRWLQRLQPLCLCCLLSEQVVPAQSCTKPKLYAPNPAALAVKGWAVSRQPAGFSSAGPCNCRRATLRPEIVKQYNE